MDEMYLKALKPNLLGINYLQCQKRFRTKERFLEYPYFLYVHKGKGKYIIDDIEYECTDGDLFFCPYGKSNTIIADDNDPYLLSGVEFEFMEGNPQTQVFDLFKENINIRNNRQFLWLTFEMINRHTTGDAGYKEYTNALLKAWLLLINNLDDGDSRASVAEDIAAWLLSNDSKCLTLDEIAKEFKYHPNYINRVFKKKFGSTLYQYHLEVRIRKAKQLLIYSNYSISEIAVLCGFEDINLFSRVFKNKTALTPTKFRNK